MAASLLDQLIARVEALEATNSERLPLATSAVINRINEPCENDEVLADAVARLGVVNTNENLYIESLEIAAGTPPLDEIPPPM